MPAPTNDQNQIDAQYLNDEYIPPTTVRERTVNDDINKTLLEAFLRRLNGASEQNGVALQENNYSGSDQDQDFS